MPQNLTMKTGLLQLDASENVFTATRTFEEGSQLIIGEQKVQINKRIPLGYKLAARNILAGEKIIKYGVPIGSASSNISTGEIVHTHNLESDYLPTYTLDEQKSFLRSHS